MAPESVMFLALLSAFLMLPILIFTFPLVIGIYILVLVYFKKTAGVCRCDRDLTGHTVIVTGASTGIGLETARNLAERNARVILACRNLTKGQAARTDIINSTGNKNVVLKLVDISSFKSVRSFAKDILETETRLDVLINNAGIMFLPARETNVDGVDMILATNHFGPFLLTNLLLPLLSSSTPSKIVMVSSFVHENARLEIDNINGQKRYDMFDMYSTSKLANVLFTTELSMRLKGTGVTVNAVNPGLVKTEIGRDANPLIMTLFEFFFGGFRKTAKQGAQTSIHLAVAEKMETVSGKYFSDCREKHLGLRALDINLSKELWDYSARITKLQEGFR